MYAEIESDKNEQSIKAIIATLILTGGIVLLLMFINLYRPNPLPTEVLIDLQLGLGDPDAGGGSGGSVKTDPAPVVKSEEESGAESTENTKESPEVKSPVNVNTKPVTNNVSTKPTNTKPSNPNALFPGMSDEGEGGGDKNGKGKGDGPYKGDGFGPDGDKPGINGAGGTDYVMEGRTPVSRPNITDSFEEEGKVVVNVWIDQNGAVTRTSINESQTNTSSSKLRSIAEKAAKKWKYSGSTKASIEQKGVVIYKFTLK